MLTFREKIGKFLFENRPLIALVLFVVAGCGAYLMKLSSDRYDSERLTTAAERYLRKGMTRDARHSLQLALKFDEDNQRARELLVQLADTGEDEPEPAGIAAQASEEGDPAGP
jgi:Tfp pilus assembly protein PilF